MKRLHNQVTAVSEVITEYRSRTNICTKLLKLSFDSSLEEINSTTGRCYFNKF